MKSLFSLSCLLIFSSFAFAQNKNEKVFAFNADWSQSNDMNNAAYFMHEVKESDTEFVCRFYQKFGPMVKQESFRDEQLKIPNGVFIWYKQNGQIDSIGHLFNGLKHGVWSFYNDSSRLEYTIEYCNGDFVKKENFNRPKTIVKTVKINKADTGKIFTVVQIPAEFPGGTKGWQQYLIHNMKTPKRFTDLAGKAGARATVKVAFTVSPAGKVSDIFLMKSYEWSVDMESLRVIKNAPDWKPAVQNGRNVIYCHLQSLTYVAEPY